MRQAGWRLGVKRAFDISVSLGVLLVAAPVFAASAIAVRATLGSPVVFRQKRPGKGGNLFTAYKLRTMRDGPEPDAERLTGLGRFLRSTSIDELPQLLNVLRGEMSLVGPRPLLVQYLERYTPEQMRRHDVLPGITGWAQINGRNTLSWEQKFAHDVWYVDNWSLLLDMKILAKTALSVVRREGISSEGHATMREFMGSTNGRAHPSP